MQVTTAIRLKQIMKERHLRQIDIVRLCEPFCKQYNLRLSKSDMSQFVNGKVTPGQWKISILSYALNVSEAWLMGFDVSPERGPTFTSEEVREAILSHDIRTEEGMAHYLEMLSQYSPERIQLLIQIADMPETEFQRVADFVAGIQAANKA